MRIGIYYHTGDRFISGVERYAIGLIRALWEVDDDNEYLIFTNDCYTLGERPGEAANFSVRPVRYVGAKALRVLWEQLCLPTRARRAKVDLLHCPTYVSPLVPLGIPSVITVHDTIALDHPEWCRWSNAAYYRLSLRRSIKNAARVIAVSHETARSVERHVPGSSFKVRVIYPGIDPTFTAKANDRDLSRVHARYNLPDRYVLYVGNIEPKKNLDVLLDAQELLTRWGFPQKLVIVGGRKWKARKIIPRIMRSVRRGDVVLTGYVPRQDLPLIYRMAGVVACVSLYEGFGFPQLEAMACGVPVVSSFRGALAETAGGAAYRVDPDDPTDIARGIGQLITDRQLRQKHIERGEQQIANLDWERAARQTLDVYRSIGGQASPRETRKGVTIP